MEPVTALPNAAAPRALPQPEVHPVTTSDGVEIRLTRYAMGTKGPLVLAPGYGNAARAFALDTVPLNFVEFLGRHDYDVWLLDYRASPDLPSSDTQFTVDDIALRDWPAAIAHIRQETGAQSVQALGHCVGGLSLFMAIAGGMEGVRSAFFSALAGHPIPTPANRLRAKARLATAFKRLGIKGLNTDFDRRSPVDRVLEVVMRVLPFKHAHDSVVGRRIYFIYGDVFDHSRIDEETMATSVPSFFGNSNMTFFEHISRMIREGRAVAADGRDAYLSHPERFRIPVTFLTGEHNRMFQPASIDATYQWLREHNGDGDYTKHVIPGYAHLDCWLGRDAGTDVFPVALAELDRHNA